MPFMRIDLNEGKPETYVQALGEGVHQAIKEVFGVPERDRFQVIAEHKRGRLIYDPGYFDIDRTDDFVLVQVTLGSGRTTVQKQEFFARLAELLEHSPGLRPQDLFVTLVENSLDNWTFGNGVAQCITVPRERWR